jgi:hypothetical protein
MRNLIKGALIRVAIATAVAAGLSTLTGVGGESGHGIRTEHTAVAANPHCAPHPIKMPCLQPDA